MDYANLFNQLETNGKVFGQMLHGKSREEYLWKPSPEKWCLLEIVCHLKDEEEDDFRTRLQHVLKTPEKQLPGIDPEGWVSARKYVEQDYNKMLEHFLHDRMISVAWLRGLKNPQWDNAYVHPKFGPLKASMFLANWAAHDYLHMRQITRLHHQYLTHTSGEDMRYAGDW